LNKASSWKIILMSLVALIRLYKFHFGSIFRLVTCKDGFWLHQPQSWFMVYVAYHYFKHNTPKEYLFIVCVVYIRLNLPFQRPHEFPASSISPKNRSAAQSWTHISNPWAMILVFPWAASKLSVHLPHHFSLFDSFISVSELTSLVSVSAPQPQRSLDPVA
jgi:hypothetical protein